MSLKAKTFPDNDDNDNVNRICSESFFSTWLSRWKLSRVRWGTSFPSSIFSTHCFICLVPLALPCLALLLPQGLILNEQPLTVYSQPGCSLTPIGFFPITSHMWHDDVKYRFTSEVSISSSFESSADFWLHGFCLTVGRVVHRLGARDGLSLIGVKWLIRRLLHMAASAG